MARNRFKRGLLPKIECRLGLDTELLSIGEFSRKATTKIELINTINLEKCEKFFSTKHKIE